MPTGNNSHMSAESIQSTLENYANLQEVYKAAQTDPDPASRVERWEQADQYMREAIDSALELSNAMPDISGLVAAMDDTAERLRTQYTKACTEAGVEPKQHVGDLDWFQNENGSWSHVNAHTIDKNAAVIDIRDLRHVHKPHLTNLGPADHDKMSQLNALTMQISQVNQTLGERELDHMADDPAASFDPPSI